MMAGVFRIGIGKLITNVKCVNKADLMLTRSITSKAFRYVDPNVKKPAPYNYKEHRYRMLYRLWDKTTSRFDENTKLIVVDSPIAAGKTEFAKTLADELGMYYMPEANLDMIYINSYDFDLRTLNDQVPKSCYLFDVKDFCHDPCNRLTASFQIKTYILRYSQYIDALAHVLSTGQGVVMERSVYSDFVFLEAMYSQGYISKLARSAYYDVKRFTITELMRPHLVIYLDVPVKKVQENIKKRNIPYEVNSKVFTTAYLTAMENAYKQKYLKEISEHAELLVYDWTDGGDVEVVVEDIERIDFEQYEKYDKKLADWRKDEEEDWAIARNTYADFKERLLCYSCIPRFDVPELVTDAEDYRLAYYIWNEAPGEKFQKGFNSKEGDKGLLFKWGKKNRDFLPLRERIIRT